ncbi:peptidyl-tRNA hydrolase ICT1, mitochondrial [Tachysurus fulvidraco]|uniref:peptidyl-tRNA hydrolase ICT1, mitochondrial n=1 Tax=Tachysurus fulvidraco TaxID=1234273 RepID=UPI001FEDD92E|nr:peptidyl-tRNA hydrolase ICT1, mitochondrial [Tachysurus fulvidraco]
MAAPVACLCFSRYLQFANRAELSGQTLFRLNCHIFLIRHLGGGQKLLAKHWDNLQGPPVDIRVDKLKVSYSRSSGPGGQHVNKVNTKAEVRFHVQTAEWIPEDVRKEILLQNKTRLNKAGELIVTSEVSRSQQKNLDHCVQKISEIISEASQRPPEPSAEDLTLRAKRLEKRNLERLKQKKIHSSTKQARQVNFD